jgi:hypothetical protein
MKHINKYLIIIFLIVFSGSVLAQEKQNEMPEIHYRITAGVNFYNAFSQKKNSLVMKMGYPVFEGMQFQIGGGISLPGKKAIHHLNINFLHIPVLRSDNEFKEQFEDTIEVTWNSMETEYYNYFKTI